MPPLLRLALPKGRMTEEVVKLLTASGLEVKSNGRAYRPPVSDSEIEAKFLKAQNIPRLLEIGAHDCGFTGHDWIEESGARVEEILDTGLDPVTLVAAAPERLVEGLERLGRPILVASEFQRLTRRYMGSRRQPYLFLRTFGATEGYPPEDADLILDLVATGMTLRENPLTVVAGILASSAPFVAARA